jgi:hypothetical protein
MIMSRHPNSGQNQNIRIANLNAFPEVEISLLREKAKQRKRKRNVMNVT